MFNPAEIDNIARVENFWWFRGMHAITFALLDPWMVRAGARRVLEAGCGTGHFARLFEDRYGVPITPVDLEFQGVRHSRHRHHLHPAQASVAALPFADSTFDLVCNLDVLPHFSPGQEAPPFSELVRVLGPGGLLLVRTAALDVFRSRHSQYVGEVQRFTRARLARLCESHRLRLVRLTYANCLLTPAAFLKFRLWEPLTRQAPASGLAPLPDWLDRLLYCPLALERRWLRAGLNFPWGQSLILLAQKPLG